MKETGMSFDQRFSFTDDQWQYFSEVVNKYRKSSKIEQDQKNVISAYVCAGLCNFISFHFFWLTKQQI